MKNKKLKKVSIINLILGYSMFVLFILLLLLNKPEAGTLKQSNIDLAFKVKYPQETVQLFTPTPHKSVENLPVKYIPTSQTFKYSQPDKQNLAYNTLYNETNTKKNSATSSILNRVNDNISYNGNRNHDSSNSLRSEIIAIDNSATKRHIDSPLLDRRLKEKKLAVKKDSEDNNKNNKEHMDFSSLSVDRGNSNNNNLDLSSSFKGGSVGNSLYAYNYPSLGIGAGVGNPAVGAGVGFAGIGAGIGEGMSAGKAVPTLGGIGASTQPTEGPPSDGVGGLVGGAAAGGTAGLIHGYVSDKLSAGMGAGKAKEAYAENDFTNLPKDGALHIMIHVDGSGSILNTRKQLDTMKETLLKDALLPYYKNDPDLYNKRVTIISNEGERSLRFFTKASKKENVLAIVFQDEAQPSYHLPNFNKKPENDYLKDLNELKNNLSSHKGIYRGIIFQVDRGNTFARSFKEFVGNAFQGNGYLKTDNLRKYYWRDNTNHIKNKDGIVFSDEYHAKDQGDPEYYLNLLFKASEKIGINLNAYGAGLTDGKYTQNTINKK